MAEASRRHAIICLNSRRFGLHRAERGALVMFIVTAASDGSVLPRVFPLASHRGAAFSEEASRDARHSLAGLDT
jgi:hypothetical protein